MVNEQKLPIQKEFYTRAEIQVFYFPTQDIVTTSPAGNSLKTNINDKGANTSGDSQNFDWWD